MIPLVYEVLYNTIGGLLENRIPTICDQSSSTADNDPTFDTN